MMGDKGLGRQFLEMLRDPRNKRVKNTDTVGS